MFAKSVTFKFRLGEMAAFHQKAIEQARNSFAQGPGSLASKVFRFLKDECEFLVHATYHSAEASAPISSQTIMPRSLRLLRCGPITWGCVAGAPNTAAPSSERHD